MDSVEDKKTFKNWFYDAMSEKGVGSAKRLAGLIITIVSMACITYLTIAAGPVVVVQDLLQTSLITGAALLGLYSITSIWKNGSMSVGGGNVSYSGEDSKQVLENVLNKQEGSKDESEDDPEKPQNNHQWGGHYNHQKHHEHDYEES